MERLVEGACICKHTIHIRHAFHVDCLRPWLAHCAREKRSLTCPTCRTPVCPAATADVEAGDVVPVNSGLE